MRVTSPSLSSFVLPLAQAHPEEFKYWLMCHFWKQDILQTNFPPARTWAHNKGNPYGWGDQPEICFQDSDLSKNMKQRDGNLLKQDLQCRKGEGASLAYYCCSFKITILWSPWDVITCFELLSRYFHIHLLTSTRTDTNKTICYK